MSRIRGIEAKAHNDAVQTRNNRCNEIVKRKYDEESCSPKDDVEKQQIAELLLKLPKLDKIFFVHRKIGEGTFSCVYLGSLRRHARLPAAERRWFAIKHLVPTAHPARVEHELRCMQDMGGQHNVIGVELCLRHFDTIVFVMPYIPHRKFSEYMSEMDAEELRGYMRALLDALRHVHSFGVIHRDVKPSNFLYDRENRRYLLVDFGLAQRMCAPPVEPAPVEPPPAHAHAHAALKRTAEEEPLPDAKRMALDLTVKDKLPARPALPPGPTPRVAPPPQTRVQIPKAITHKTVPAGRASSAECGCAGAGGVCSVCARRPTARAPRAGTQGFRPPEVLLKCPHQTTAVDTWACGVVLASVLCARYPFFRAGDDASALAELADLLGTAALQRTAHVLGRHLVTSSSRRGVCLRKLCARLRGSTPARGTGAAPARGTGAAPAPGSGAAPNAPPCPRCQLPRVECLCIDPTKSASAIREGASVCGFPDSAFSLAARLLEPDPRRRLSAADALRHPFLAP